MIALAAMMLAGFLIVGVTWLTLTSIWYGRQVDDDTNSDGP